MAKKLIPKSLISQYFSGRRRRKRRRSEQKQQLAARHRKGPWI
jgi:hypothetical protein